MNILWVSHNVPYPPKMGVLQRNYNLLKQLARVGDIYLVAMSQKNILPIRVDLAEARRELGRFCRYVEIVPIPTDSSRVAWYGLLLGSVFTSRPYSVNWLRCAAVPRAIHALVRRVPFHVAHFDTIGLAEYRSGVGDVPTVLNHHNIESQLMERRSRIERNALKRLYFKMEATKLRRYEDEHCRDFDLNVTVSELDKSRLSRIVPASRIVVIPNGVDTDYFRPQPENIIRGNLVFVGGMNWYPNRDAVLYLGKEIWPILKREIPEVSLTLVGGAPPREFLDRAHRDPRVRVTGFVDDVRPYLHRAEVYVCPMRDGGGTRLKILDALAVGKAIVSTSIGCEGIAVEPGRDVLIADTPRQFVDHVKRALADSHTRNRLGEAGRALAERQYSWTAIGQRLNHVYRELARSQPGAETNSGVRKRPISDGRAPRRPEGRPSCQSHA